MMDKQKLISDMQAKLEVLADAKGTFRCGLIWDLASGLKRLSEVLKEDDEAHKQQIEAMKQMLQNKEE